MRNRIAALVFVACLVFMAGADEGPKSPFDTAMNGLTAVGASGFVYAVAAVIKEWNNRKFGKEQIERREQINADLKAHHDEVVSGLKLTVSELKADRDSEKARADAMFREMAKAGLAAAGYTAPVTAEPEAPQ